jgi:uncharacterized protein (TIGR03067 family)
MMKRISSISALIALLVSVPAGAEVPLKSKAQLQNGATHIIVGKVETVYSVTGESEDWVDTKSVAEIAVQRVEKGDRIQAGDLVYGRFWNRRWIGKGNPDPYSRGHMGPKAGELVRAYLVRKDGGYDVILPNGFEESPKLEPGQAKKEHADLQGTWGFVYYEEKGVAEEPGTKQFVIAENRLDFRAGGQTRVETTIEVDAAQSPNHFTQKFKDGQVYRSIYVLTGDYMILCGIRDGGRPAEFSCGTDKGGDFLIVLKRQP